MPGVSASVTVKGTREVQQTLQRVAGSVASSGGRTGLHARWAILATRWIDRNFQSEGAMTGQPWKRLTPMTVAGRRKMSNRVLQDTGLLRASFHPAWDDKAARVGTASEVSKYHEFGTRGPYKIEPKRAKVLAWKVAGPFSSPKTKGLRTGRVKASFSSLTTKTTFRKGENVVFARSVIHPGLPARRMLPRMGEPTLMPELLKSALNYVKEQERAQGQGT